MLASCRQIGYNLFVGDICLTHTILGGAALEVEKIVIYPNGVAMIVFKNGTTYVVPPENIERLEDEQDNS